MEPSSDEQWQAGLDMAQRALAVKNDALHLLVDELEAARTCSDFLAAKACAVDGMTQVLDELQLVRQQAAAARADAAALQEALEQERRRSQGLEAELQATTDAALELWESVQMGGATTEEASSFAGSDGGEGWGSPSDGSGASEGGGGGPAARSALASAAVAAMTPAGAALEAGALQPPLVPRSHRLMATMEAWQARLSSPSTSPSPTPAEACAAPGGGSTPPKQAAGGPQPSARDAQRTMADQVA